MRGNGCAFGAWSVIAAAAAMLKPVAARLALAAIVVSAGLRLRLAAGDE